MAIRHETSSAELFQLVVGLESDLPIAMLLFDDSEGRVFMRFRPNLSELVGEDQLEVIAGVEDHLVTLIRDDGARSVVRWMEETLSGFVRLVGPLSIQRPLNWKESLDDAYARYIENGNALAVTD